MKRWLILLLTVLLTLWTGLALAEEGVSAAPTVHALMADSIGVSGAGVPGSTIRVTWVAVGLTEQTVVQANGQWAAYPSNGYILRAGDLIRVTQIQPGAMESAAVVRMAGKTISPVVHDIFLGALTITGEGIPGARIVVSFPNGGGPVVTVVGGGVWVVTVPEGVFLQTGDIVRVSQQEGILIPSDEMRVQVGGVDQPPTPAATVIGNCVEWVNLRPGPSTAGAAIGRAYLGETIEILGWDSTGVWANVRCGGGTGWIHGKFIIAP